MIRITIAAFFVILCSGCPTVSTTAPGQTDVQARTVTPAPLTRTLSISTDNLLKEDFSDNLRRWEESDSTDLYEKVEKGSYTIHLIGNAEIAYSTVEAPKLTGNFVLSADFEKCEGKAGHAYGLIWGMNDTENCSMIVLADTGYYTYGNAKKGAFVPVKDWTHSASLLKGNAKNSIAVKRRGDRCELYFNRRYECEVPFTEPFGNRIGFIVYPTVCVSIDALNLSTYALSVQDTIGENAEDAYESANFDTIDLGGVEESVWCFDYESLVLRTSDQALGLLAKKENRKALELLSNSIPLAKKIAPLDEDILAFLLEKAGTAQFDLGKPDEALSSLVEALRLCKQNEKIPQCSGIASFIARIHEKAGRLDDAVEYYAEAVGFADKEKDQAAKASNLRSLGSAYSSLGMHDKAVDSYNSALSIDEGKNDKILALEDATGAARALEMLGMPDESLSLYKKSLAYAKELKNDTKIKECSYDSARIGHLLQLYSTSIEDYETARKSAMAVKDTDTALSCLSNMADIRAILGDKPQATKAFEAAISFAKLNKKNDALFDLQRRLYLSYADAGDHGRASSFLSTLANEARNAKNQMREASAIHDAGLVSYKAGETDKALSLFRESARLYIANYDFAAASKEYGFIASSYSASGDPDLALEYSAKSVSQAELYADKKIFTGILLDAASLYYDWGYSDDAVLLYTRAIDDAGGTGHSDERVRALLGLAKLYTQSRDNGKASEYLGKAVALARETKKRELLADTLAESARFHGNTGNTKKASDYLSEASDIFAVIGLKDAELSCMESKSMILVKDKNYKEAEEHLSRALSLAEKIGSVYETARITGAIGDIAFLLGNYKKAVDDYRHAISIADKLIARTGRIEKKTLIDFEILRYGTLRDAYISSSDALPAFDAGEKASNLRLLSVTGFAGASGMQSVNTFDTVRKSLGADTALIAYALGSADDLLLMCGTDKGIKSAILILSDFTDAVMKQIKGKIPESGLSTAKLEENEERFLVSGDMQSKKIDFISITRYYASLVGSPSTGDGSNPDTNAVSREFYELIIEPIRQSLLSKTKLIVFPDYSAGFFPLETLANEKGERLFGAYSISYAHSAGVYSSVIKRKADRNRKNGLYVEGYTPSVNVSFRGTNLSRIRNTNVLAHIGEDADYTGIYKHAGINGRTYAYAPPDSQAIGRLFEGWESVRGKTADEKSIGLLSSSGRLGDYAWIHVDAPADLFSTFPSLSCIYLAPSNAQGGNDGFLRLSELSRLKLDAECASVSVLGIDPLDPGKGEVFAALAESFLVSGASGVILPFIQSDNSYGNRFISKLFDYAVKNGISAYDAFAKSNGIADAGAGSPGRWSGFVYFGR